MSKRKLNGIDIIPIGFGTATFVEGKLCPNADSESGIELLRFAVQHGMTVTHSAKNLKTQWGIREAIESAYKKDEQFQHIVKVKIGNGFAYDDLERIYNENASSIGFGILLLQLEFDKKIDSTERESILHNLIDNNITNQFPLYLHLADEADASKYIGLNGFAGYSAKYSDCKSWLEKYVSTIEKNNQDLIVFAPFRNRNENESTSNILQQLLLHKGVKCVVISSGNANHWIENINAALGVNNDCIGINI